MIMFKKLLKIIIMFLFCTYTIGILSSSKNVQAVESEYEEPSQQLRAIWFSHFINDIPSFQDPDSYKTSINKVLTNLESLNINTIFFHLRTHNNALYDSDLNPKAKWFAKVDFSSFDPITWIIEECHKRGIEFHAWLNPYRVASLSETITLESVVESYKDYPKNPASDINNYLFNDVMSILNPALPNVRAFIGDTINEIITKYDIDGIHFDDYFYISKVDDSKSVNEYNVNDLSLNDFRRSQVDLLIENLSKQIKKYNIENNKAIQFGIAPPGVYRVINTKYPFSPKYNENNDLVAPVGSYSTVATQGHYDGSTLCDTKKWIDNEWIDYIMPQVYGNFGYANYEFDNLTGWWSLVTKYKKTNLYIGVGSAYANNLTRGWTSGDDLRKILSYFASNKEIVGTSYFNYSSLVADNQVMKDFRKVNNEYYSVKVPSSEIKNMDYIESIPITGLKFDLGVLSWNEVTNARGYMVWKVPNNELIDITKAKYLVSYTNETKINISIEDGFKYYVSSINKANKISNSVPLDMYNNANNVVNYIYKINIPEIIDEDIISYVNRVNKEYLLLSEEDKNKVTNINILKDALLRIENYNIMVDIFDEYVQSFNGHIYGDSFSFPKTLYDYKLNWSSNEYLDYESSKKLINSYGPFVSEVKVTISNEDNIYERFITLNLGTLENDGSYLFYRNASGAMIKEDPQDYEGNFIGVSDCILKYENYYLFIADGNHIKLISSTIPDYRFPSCGVIYENTSNQSITINVKSLPLPYGDIGFVISDGEKIILADKTILDYENVTLKSGDFLFIGKPLDGRINGTPFTNINKTWIEKNATIISFTDFKKATEFNIKVLDALESKNINEFKILLDEYETLINDIKICVKNILKVQDCYNELKKTEELKLSIQEIMININSYPKDLSIYSTQNQKVIKELQKNYIDKTTMVQTIEELDDILDEYKVEIDDINTIEEEKIIQDKLIKEGIDRINNYPLNLNVYSYINKDLIKEIKDTYINNIANSSDKEMIDNYINEYKEKIDIILTIEEEDLIKKNALEDKKESTLKTVNDYTISVNTDEALASFNTLKDNVKNKINKCQSIEEITSELDAFYIEASKIKDVIIEEEGGCTSLISLYDVFSFMGLVIILIKIKNKQKMNI